MMCNARHHPFSRVPSRHCVVMVCVCMYGCIRVELPGESEFACTCAYLLLASTVSRIPFPHVVCVGECVGMEAMGF